MSRFRRNPRFEDAVLRTREVREHLERVTEEGARNAEALAPDDPDTSSSEDLAGSIRGEVVLTRRGYRGRVLAMNYKAPFWEFGTVKNEPRPFLAPGVEQTGLRVDDRGAGEVTHDD